MLRLIRKDETAEVAIGETTFVVRLQSHAEAKALRLRHATRGRVDEAKLGADFWGAHLVGWRNLGDADGEPIPFDPKVVLTVVDALPDDVIMVLTARIREPQVAHKEALGNGKPSSVSAS